MNARGKVVSPASWDYRETVNTRFEHGDFVTFTMPNGWTKTSRKWEDGSVLVPSDWHSFIGYKLITPDGDHAEVVDWYSPPGELTVRVGSHLFIYPEGEVYSSWAWGGVSDVEKGIRPRGGLVHRSEWLYRMFDESGALLYVGISDNATRRWREHERDKPWFDEVCTFTREKYHDRASVEQAERDAIRMERPKYNVTFNSRSAA